MRSLNLKALSVACAAASACPIAGCLGSPNEAGNGVITTQEAGASAATGPGNMQEFVKQQKEMEKAAREKKGSRPTK